jgi:2-C-methyl-D-erythritol 4-phosphate cytidylyltransferase
VPVAGRPLIEWSVKAFGAAERIGAVVVALPPGHPAELGPRVVTIAGGQRRSESVAAALALVETELVAIHDAARPLVTAKLIDALVAELDSRPDAAAVIAATALTDTVKRARGARSSGGELAEDAATVAETVSRDHLWAAQTPQVFRTAALREAISANPARVAAATDEAMLVERAGGKVLIHPCGPENLKVTTALDLRIAALLLAERGG